MLNLVKTYETVNNVKIPHYIGPRRKGDSDVYFCSPMKAKCYLDWHPKYTIANACRDAYNFARKEAESNGEQR